MIASGRAKCPDRARSTATAHQDPCHYLGKQSLGYLTLWIDDSMISPWSGQLGSGHLAPTGQCTVESSNGSVCGS